MIPVDGGTEELRFHSLSGCPGKGKKYKKAQKETAQVRTCVW